MQKLASVVALSLLACVFLTADSSAGILAAQDPTCLYACAAIEGPPTDNGTLPPGATMTVTPGDSTPGGTDTIPACDDCLACKQSFLVQYDTNGTTFFWWIDNGEDPLEQMGLVNGSGYFRVTAKPFCGESRDLHIFWPTYTITFPFSCDC